MKDLETFKKKLIYRSNYRGTKEMDILLGNFVRTHIDKLTESELFDLDKFLNLEDEIILNFYNNGFINKKLSENKISVLLKNYKL